MGEQTENPTEKRKVREGTIGVLSYGIIEKLDSIPQHKRRPEHASLRMVYEDRANFKVLNVNPAKGNGVGDSYASILVLEGRLEGATLPVCTKFIVSTSAGHKEGPAQEVEEVLQF